MQMNSVTFILKLFLFFYYIGSYAFNYFLITNKIQYYSACNHNNSKILANNRIPFSFVCVYATRDYNTNCKSAIQRNLLNEIIDLFYNRPVLT